ncbi:MAG: redoxin domain-containing protein [Verrucomicrobiia bacterium]|jgi:peroxiredoxin/outer membrane protein assembly factor BamB
MSATSEQPVVVPPPLPRTGFAITSLVLGIVAVCLSFLVLGALLGLVGLVFGLIQLRRRGSPKKMAWWGFSLSVFGLLASIGFGVLYFEFFKHFQAAMESASGTDLAQWEGVTAPDFTVTALDGTKTTLSALKGKRVVLDFWATWCPPCRKEIPHFVRLTKETSRDDVVIIGISSEEEKTLRSFVGKNGMNYPVASATNLPAPYESVESIPTTFFIDRHGVIQKVAVGYHDFDSLKEQALNKDWEGTPKSAPETPVSSLTVSDHPLQAVPAWRKEVPGALAICAGDWYGDGQQEILVADNRPQLHILGSDGSEKNALPIAGTFTMIECGHRKRQDPRLLGYSNWGREVVVMDSQGKRLWSYSSLSGVDGAHWGDLDGDGTDELIVGMNGGGGLHAVDADGKKLWKASLGNVWNQAVVSARTNQPALVFATEAGGSVQVFDAKGRLLRTVRPQGKYCAQMSAAAVTDQGTIQAIAIGDGRTIAFDPTGTIAWSTSAIKDNAAWRNVNFANGDLIGDGRREWAFLEASGDLVIASVLGEKLGTIPAQKGIESFAIANTPGAGGILVTLKSGAMQAYRFAPSPITASTGKIEIAR